VVHSRWLYLGFTSIQDLLQRDAILTYHFRLVKSDSVIQRVVFIVSRGPTQQALGGGAEQVQIVVVKK